MLGQNPQQMKEFVRDALFSIGFRLGGIRSDDIRVLIKCLQPQDCGRDLIRIGGEADDRDHVSDKPHLKLPCCWYAQCY